MAFSEDVNQQHKSDTISIYYFKALFQNLLGGTDENHDMLGLNVGGHEISERLSGKLSYRITKFVLLKLNIVE
jgi:hypothetical protein